MTLTTFHTARRQVDVWIPEDGFTGPRPLLVMHDGENLFDDAKAAFGVSWGVLKALETLTVAQPVVIGAFNTGMTRAAEYAPQDVLESLPDESYQFVGNPPLKPLLGNAYQTELAEEIIPAVLKMADIDFRPERVAVCGSSMGGHASLYAMSKYPEIYGTALCLSTHWALSTENLARAFVRTLPEPSQGHRIWLDHGTLGLDETYGPIQAAVDLEFSARGFVWPQIESRRYIGTNHNEASWSARLPEILQWWLEK